MTCLFWIILNRPTHGPQPEQGPHQQQLETILTERDFNGALEGDRSEQTWLPDLHLTQADKTAIESETMWMNDRIINAYLLLMKEKFPALTGFADPVFVAALRVHFKDEVFCQILFNGDNHWVAVTNMNCVANTVRIYDSLHLIPSLAIKQQIAAVCFSDKSEIHIQSMNVARQNGGNDCGLFAMACLTSVCMGQDPVNVVYQQILMRKHLLQCLVTKKITGFPLQSHRTIRKPISSSITLKLFCLCRQVFCRGAKMIECTRCKEWYHQSCLKMSSDAFDKAALNKSFLCVGCVPDDQVNL